MDTLEVCISYLWYVTALCYTQTFGPALLIYTNSQCSAATNMKILFLSSTLLRPSQTLFGVSVCLSHFSKKIGIRKKKNGICQKKWNLYWILDFWRPPARGRRPPSQKISRGLVEITLTTQDPHPIFYSYTRRFFLNDILAFLKI